jgi:transcriptional regulator with XRE-family HTH domain
VSTPASFPELVRRARARLGYDLQTTARGAGCSESYVSLIEADKRLPSEELAVRLARTLQIDPTDALLALMRSRLPAPVRQLLDPGTLVRDATAQFAISRHFLASHCNARVATITSRLAIEWSGDAVLSHRLEGIEPVAGRPPIKEIVLREPLPAGSAAEVVNQNHKPRILAAPRGLHFEYEGHLAGASYQHVLTFPAGFRAGAGTGAVLSFETRIEVKRGFDMDLQATAAGRGGASGRNHPLSWSFPRYLPLPADRLVVEVSFPAGYRPDGLRPIAWIGDGPIDDVADNLIDSGVCRSHTFAVEGETATLAVDEPLVHYSYGVIWRPMERAAAIDARR